MLWPVRIHAQPPWRGEHPLRGLYSPMDPRSNCASGRTAGQDGSNMQGMGRPSKGLIAFFVCGQARTSRTSPRTVARTAATRVGSSASTPRRGRERLERRAASLTIDTLSFRERMVRRPARNRSRQFAGRRGEPPFFMQAQVLQAALTRSAKGLVQRAARDRGPLRVLRGPPPLHQALLAAHADGLELPGPDGPRDPGGGQGQQAH